MGIQLRKDHPGCHRFKNGRVATRTGAIARVSVRSGVVEDPRHTRNLLIKVPKFKLLAEQGRKLRLDDDAEQKLLAAAKACNWKPDRFELFRDVIILARDTGIRNGRELYRIRAENLD